MKTRILNGLPQGISILLPQEIIEVRVEMEKRLPKPDLVTYFVLEQDRKLYLEGEIGEESMSIQRMILRWNLEDQGIPVEERKPIRLFIFSPGGDVDTM